MSMRIILIIICTGIFVLLNFAVGVYCDKEEIKKSWNDKKYIDAILNAIGYIMMIIGCVIPKLNYFTFIGLCVIIVANAIYAIGVARHMKDSKPSNDTDNRVD